MSVSTSNGFALSSPSAALQILIGSTTLLAFECGCTTPNSLHVPEIAPINALMVPPLRGSEPLVGLRLRDGRHRTHSVQLRSGCG
jgi:hypothetical protein